MRSGFLPKKAANHMLEQANSLLFDQLVDHVAEDCSNSIEALIRLANICETDIIQEDFLYDENGNRLAQL